MELNTIGYIATSTSVLGVSSQAYHLYRSKTTAGISLYRTLFDVLSLGLWVYYAARVEDNPLLIATAFEFLFSAVIMMFYLKHRPKQYAIKDYTPPPSPPHSDTSTGSTLIEVKIDRRNSI